MINKPSARLMKKQRETEQHYQSMGQLPHLENPLPINTGDTLFSTAHETYANFNNML